jgi:two-component system, cell cycle sensor histidine kinase and response regulator CckA
MNEKHIILIVDDTPENLQVLGDMLESEGYEVLVATNGLEALENAKASPPPDLILLDIMMPGMDGYEVCRCLKADPDLNRIPVIFISALGLTDQKIQAFREGAVDYVTKPFQAEEVVARVHTHLQLAQLEALKHEIAERRRAEESLKEQTEELTAIYENAPLVMMIVDEHAVVKKVNSPVSAFNSIPLSEIVGRNVADAINCVHAPERYDNNPFCSDCMICSTLINIFQMGSAPVQLEGKFRYSRDGKELVSYFLLSVTKLTFRSEPAALVCLLDITEQRQLREQMLQQQKLESIGLMVSGITHDFNNMLLPIFGYAQMIQNKVVPDDKIYGFATAILETADKAKNLVQQLLSFSRKRPLTVESHDLNEIVASFLKMLGSTLRGNIAIRQELCTGPCRVQADRVQLEQIILNLAVNAQDAISGAGSITVTTGPAVFDEAYCRSHPGAKPGSYVMLQFADSGSGMDEAVLSHIFDPFFTTKPAGQGTGLGLSTVFGIIKQHNGFVEVDSRLGAGTTFRIYLPTDIGREKAPVNPSAT